jgi:TonB family protein
VKRVIRAVFALLIILAAHSRRGWTQSSSMDKAIATKLFDDAERLMIAGKAVAACPKFGESHRRDPQLGTLLHLADCYEKLGKTASAWAAFKEALEIAERRNASGLNEPRERTARDRAAALEVRLSKLTITVAEPPAPGLEIKQDGEPVEPAVWDTALPVDPGAYVITAEAPGKKIWSEKVEVPDGANTVVTVPPLENESLPMTRGPAVPTLSAVPFGQEMTRPTLISGNQLVYPREAIVASIAGTIITKCTITAEGTVRNCRIVRGLPFLDKPAIEMLATRRYTPAISQGRPVSVEYVFNLKVAPPNAR